MTSKTYPTISFYKILTYPFSFSSLIIIFVTSMFISFALLGPVMALLVVFGLGMFSLWFTKYAFSVLIHTAEGYSDIPEFGESIIRPLEDFRPGKLLIILMSHIMILGSLLSFNIALGYTYAIALLAFLPAIISVLGMENKLIQTFNVLLLTSIIKCSGKFYWLSFGFYCVMVVLLMNVYDSDIATFFSVFITLYLILVSFHVIGLTLYTRRNEMGYATAYSPEQDEIDIEGNTLKQYQRIATNIYSRYRQPSVLPYLEEQLKNEPLTSYNWFYSEIMSWEIKPKFKQLFIELYCRKHCEENQVTQALSQLRDYQKSDPGFTISDNATRVCLLKAAISIQDKHLLQELQFTLLNEKDDHKHYRKTLVLLSQYYMEKQPNDELARKMIALLLKSDPNMASDQKIKQYQTILNHT